MKNIKVVTINGTNYGSTGKIIRNISIFGKENNVDVYTFCKSSKKSHCFKYENQKYIGYRYERIISEILGEITSFKDCFNILGTIKLLRDINVIDPDIIHLNTLHDSYINLSMFFKYLSKKNKTVIWTLHDLWALTGHCPGFDKIDCIKWKTGCYACPLINEYPKVIFFDRSKPLWKKKKRLFTSVNNMTIISPSINYTNYIKQSYLKKYPIEVINNGIDLNIFKPTNSDFREKYGLIDKYIILSVAYKWSDVKGLKDMIEMSKSLSKKYAIVMVGTDKEIDNLLPENIISIHRTYDQYELVKIYSASDVFVIPTLSDNFPTVNIESLACGTPVITYDTGGSPEIINSECGSVVEKGNTKALIEEVIRVCETKPYSKEACLKRAKQLDANITSKKYIELYKKIANQ